MMIDYQKWSYFFLVLIFITVTFTTGKFALASGPNGNAKALIGLGVLFALTFVMPMVVFMVTLLMLPILWLKYGDTYKAAYNYLQNIHINLKGQN